MEPVQLLVTSSQERGAASSAENSAEWQKLTEKHNDEHHEFRGDELEDEQATQDSRSCVGPLDQTTETGARRDRATLRPNNVQHRGGRSEAHEAMTQLADAYSQNP